MESHFHRRETAVALQGGYLLQRKACYFVQQQRISGFRCKLSQCYQQGLLPAMVFIGCVERFCLLVYAVQRSKPSPETAASLLLKTPQNDAKQPGTKARGLAQGAYLFERLQQRLLEYILSRRRRPRGAEQAAIARRILVVWTQDFYKSSGSQKATSRSFLLLMQKEGQRSHGL